jgi:hypothetical protein
MSSIIVKSEAVHAPSPLQQEPEPASKRQSFKAVWSEATKSLVVIVKSEAVHAPSPL